jgi:hypothetical protein
LFVRPGESPIGRKAKLCDPSFHSDFKREELQKHLDRINRMEMLIQNTRKEAKAEKQASFLFKLKAYR